MIPRPSGALAIVLAGTWLAACPEPPGDRAELEAVPLPMDLDRLEVTVRDQLRERYAEVERRSAHAGTDAGTLAPAFGELGQALAAYHYWQPASAAFGNAEQLAPAPRWSYYLGHAERRLGHLAESTAAFERVLAARSTDLPALVWLGENQLDLGRLEAARGRFQQAVLVAPDCVQALFGLGRVALEAGDAEAAARHLEAAYERQPGSSRIRYSLALALRQLGDTERAAALFAEVESGHLAAVPIALDDPLMAAIEELRRGAMVHEQRGLIAASRGRMQRAAYELRQAVTLDPERAEAWHNLGLALMRLGRRQAGEQELRRLLERHPEHAPTQLLLGNLAAEQGDLDEAERRLRAALDADPDLPGARRALADVLHRAGRPAEADELMAVTRDGGES